MKIFLQAILLLIFSIGMYAQSLDVNGYVFDDEQVPLLGATVVILEGSDSTMVAFGITDESGKFLIHEVPADSIILQVNYTGYADYGKELDLTGVQSKYDAGQIEMQVSNAILEEVSIKAEHIPMGILGDTINYNASAFQTRPGASVEDLLKKLPGIEVARDGSIKAQGEDVESVLVDGKEFFSGDATIATKNLEAEAVDKVQVYDKKSEEAEFTGIDDGQDEKTINLKLKDGFKNGGFGKVALDAGTEDVRQAKLNYNRFSPSVQASIIGNTNNINNQAFSFNEYIDFMGGFQNVLAMGGMAEYGVGPGGQMGQQGITDQKSVGTNLNVDVSKKVQFNANYLFGQNDRVLEESGSTKNFTNDRTFTTVDTSNLLSNTTNHRLNTKLKYNPNSRNNFTLNTRLFKLGNSDINNSMSDFLVDGVNENMTSTNSKNESSSYNLSSDVLYKKKFSKKGRNWISNLKYERMQRDEEANLANAILTMDEETFINQLQEFSNSRSTIFGNTRYTEPIGKGLYLGMNYDFNRVVQTPVRDYFDKIENDLVLDEDISSLFSSEWMFHRVGMSLKRNRKKFNLTLAAKYMNAGLVAEENRVQLTSNRRFHYVLPAMSAQWKMKGSKSLEFNYFTRVNAPQLSQLVTQVNNLNPNFLILGNPNLVPEYVHTMSLKYSAFDQFNFSNQFANISFSYSPNKIVNSRNLSEDLVTEILPLNSGNHISVNAYMSHSSPIRKLKMKFNISSSITYSKYNTFIDAVENDISNGNMNLKLGIENRNKDVVDIAGGLRLDLSAFSNEFNSNFDNPFINHSWYMDGFVNVGKGFNFSTSYDYRTFNGAFFQDAQVLHLINARFSKTFLSDKLTLTITAHDILNQNRGIGRSGDINSLSDSRYNTLGRYIMVGASYRIGMVKKSGIDFDVN